MHVIALHPGPTCDLIRPRSLRPTARPTPVTPGAGSRRRVEELLLAGLDHYFAGQHELAINVWTRVLFLDRGHARARAYIERARGAIAERQREGRRAAAHRRRGVRARRLGRAPPAADVGGRARRRRPRKRWRCSTGSTGSRPRGVAGRRAARGRPRRARRRAARMAGPRRFARSLDRRRVAAGAVLGIATVDRIAVLWARGQDWLADSAGAATAAARSARANPLPVPSASEVWLARARDLLAKGPPPRGAGRARRGPSRRRAARAGRRAPRRDPAAAARGGARRRPGRRRGPAPGCAAPMRCPKCQYISFDSGERCRNCGYEFSLSPVDDDDRSTCRSRPATKRSGRCATSAADSMRSAPNRPAASASTPPARPAAPARRRAARTRRRPARSAAVQRSGRDDDAPLVTPPRCRARRCRSAESTSPSPASRAGRSRTSRRSISARLDARTMPTRGADAAGAAAGTASIADRAGGVAPARRRRRRPRSIVAHPGRASTRGRAVFHAASSASLPFERRGACCRSCRSPRSCCCSTAATSCCSPRPAARRSARWRPASGSCRDGDAAGAASGSARRRRGARRRLPRLACCRRGSASCRRSSAPSAAPCTIALADTRVVRA